MPDYEFIRENLEGQMFHLKGIDRESAKYKIEKINSIMKGADYQYMITTTKLVPHEKMIEKINKEKNFIKGYRKLLMYDNTFLGYIEDHLQFNKIKVMLYEKELPYYVNAEGKDQLIEDYTFQKTNGSLSLTLLGFEMDPIFEVSRIDVYIDLKLNQSLQLVEGNRIDITFENSAEMEIFLFGQNGPVLGVLYLPCEFFVDKDASVLELDFRNFNYLKVEATFNTEIRLVRHNAKILYVFKEGHELKELYTYTPRICGVCGGFLPLFSYNYRCRRCKFTTHKECASWVLFHCKNSVEIDNMDYKKSYDITHVLEETIGSGFRYCNHCGDRLNTANKILICVKCDHRYHEGCEMNVFNSCEISLELRKSMAEFIPPISKDKRPHQTRTINDYDLIRVLGRGNFGKVLLAQEKATGEHVALKILRKEKIVNITDVTYIEVERKILALAAYYKHPFLMQMFHCFQDSKNLYFGCEYVTGGDLFTHTVRNSFGNLSIPLYAAEILLGINFLHTKHYIYRDLKLDNILLGADGHVKICDFGLCKEGVGPMAYTQTYCGTLDTIAPEIIKGEPYTNVVDWWSYGIVLYELYEKKPPFPGATSSELSKSILTLTPIFGVNTPSKAKDLISKLLCKTPQERYGYGPDGVEKIKNHAYFQEINWKDVHEKKITPLFKPGGDVSNIDKSVMNASPNISPSNSNYDYDQYFMNFK